MIDETIYNVCVTMDDGTQYLERMDIYHIRSITEAMETCKTVTFPCDGGFITILAEDISTCKWKEV